MQIASLTHPFGCGHPSEGLVARMKDTPGVQQVPSPKVAMFIRKNFLDADTCAELMRLIDLDRRPSTIADPNGDNYVRTSETCDLKSADAIVHRVEMAIADLLGIDPKHGEPLQGQRYEVGQEFKAHTDYFEPTGRDYARYCTVAGQRTWTAMVYLNEVDAGGATRFKAIDKIVQPETGKLITWNNMRPNGTVNPSTLHHAMKVRTGTKYVITKWFRERPWG